MKKWLSGTLLSTPHLGLAILVLEMVCYKRNIGPASRVEPVLKTTSVKRPPVLRPPFQTIKSVFFTNSPVLRDHNFVSPLRQTKLHQLEVRPGIHVPGSGSGSIWDRINWITSWYLCIHGFCLFYLIHNIPHAAVISWSMSICPIWHTVHCHCYCRCLIREFPA